MKMANIEKISKWPHVNKLIKHATFTGDAFTPLRNCPIYPSMRPGILKLDKSDSFTVNCCEQAYVMYLHTQDYFVNDFAATVITVMLNFFLFFSLK